MGDWHLLFDSDQPLEVLSYVRGRDGFVTSMHEVARADVEGTHSIHFLNPASNWRQMSLLESPTDYRHLSNLSTVPSDALILPTRYAEPY